MAADDIAAVNLPPIVPTGDTPPHDSRRGSNEKSRGKDKAKNQNQNQNSNPDKDRHPSDPADPNRQQPEPHLRERKAPHADVDFELPEHELDKFA